MSLYYSLSLGIHPCLASHTLLCRYTVEAPVFAIAFHATAYRSDRRLHQQRWDCFIHCSRIPPIIGIFLDLAIAVWEHRVDPLLHQKQAIRPTTALLECPSRRRLTDHSLLDHVRRTLAPIYRANDQASTSGKISRQGRFSPAQTLKPS